MRLLSTLIVSAVIALGTPAPSAAAGLDADGLDADELIAQMKAAIEPPKPSTRLMTLSWSYGGKTSTIELIQARKSFPDGARSLTFATQPPEARGMAYLVEERIGSENVEFRYIPVIRRVRELVPAENHTDLLGTDFTYGDLGFLPLESENTFLGVGTLDGKQAYKVASVPTAGTKQWYYSRYVTWIDPETKLPIKREFYSPGNTVFKVETFDEVTVVDGVPTPTRITMKNLPSQSTSELIVRSISYEHAIPDEFFTPEKLRVLSEAGNPAEKAAKATAR